MGYLGLPLKKMVDLSMANCECHNQMGLTESSWNHHGKSLGNCWHRLEWQKLNTERRYKGGVYQNSEKLPRVHGINVIKCHPDASIKVSFLL